MLIVPQLPIKNRYTSNFAGMWHEKLKELGVDSQLSHQQEPQRLGEKYFTNVHNAIQFELTALSNLMNMADTDNKILFLDIDFPGICTPFVQAFKLLNPEIECYGYLHAGSWCNGDVWKDTEGKFEQEATMMLTFDKIFVATDYHKKKIDNVFGHGWNNVKIVGFPFYQQDLHEEAGGTLTFEDKDLIFINGRMEQSNKELVQNIVKAFQAETYTSAAIKDRKDYLDMLQSSKVCISLKTEETFGLGLVEAVAMDCLPLVPDKFAYPEVIDNESCRYQNESGLMYKLEQLMKRSTPIKFDLERWEKTIPKVVKEMGL